MRAPLLAALLVLSTFAGCVTQPAADIEAASLSLEVAVPAGATLIEETGRSILRFLDVELPFKTDVTIPAGTTLVRAQAEIADKVPVTVGMSNQETGRRRCNLDRVDAWYPSLTSVNTCSGIAAIDPPGAVWTVTAGAAGIAKATRVDVVLETTPLDGIVATLDLSQLSMPTHELQKTTYGTIPSFDGTPLWVEVTLPEGPGPWPTIIGSSPYNTRYGRGETPAMWTYFTHDWAKRGYAIVNADVRGFGMSGGCVEIWGENEQKDQAFLVDWVAKQEWSDGTVGFYGQSYVATTPVEAAVLAPEALKAIVAVAPVMNAYDDWHYGGVPNGESTGSVAAYQVLTDTAVPPSDPMSVDPVTLAMLAPNGVCDPTIVARANDPRAVYDAFYEERNFSARASEVKAAVLYTQGFEDSNVKSAMIPGWFNDVTAPKLGLFGHWVHQHPTRADEEILFLGWMDQYVKGKPLGLDKVEPVHVIVDDATYRTGATWPPVEAIDLVLPAEGLQGAIPLVRREAIPLGLEGIPIQVIDVTEDIAVSGTPRIAISGTLLPAGNAHFRAELFDVDPDGNRALMSYGAFNLAHRGGHDAWTPSAPGETTSFELPFLPTEHVFRAGHKIGVSVYGMTALDEAPESTSQPGVYQVESASLVLPTLPMTVYAPAPATATR